MKRLISMCIIFALIMSIPVSCVYAEDLPGSQNYNFELITALGIDKGITKEDNEIINRAEFTAMAVRSLNMGGLGTPDGSFTDVSTDYIFANEIYMAKNLRMTNGTAEGVFSPESPVTANVALKMLLTAMGYEVVAQAKGGYPNGYLAIERSLGILDGISNSPELTVYDAKLIITNALKADMVVFSSIKGEDIIVSSNSGRNLLTERFDLDCVSGIAETAGYITYSLDVPTENSLSVSGMDFKCLVDATPYFGMYITAYYKDGEVLAIEKSDINNVVKINSTDINGFSNNVLSVNSNNKEFKYRTDTSLSFIKNGRLIIHKASDFMFPNGTLTLIDNNGDRVYDVVIAEVTDYFVVDGINEATSTIYDQNSTIGAISFDTNDSNKVCKLLNEKGMEMSVSELSINAVLQVIASQDGKICIVRYADSKTVGGVVEEITQDGYIINGVEYIPNTYFKSRGIVINPGENYTFLLAPDATVTSTIGDGSNGIVYGYLVDAAHKSGLEKGIMLKLLTSSGDVAVMELSNKITLNGTSGVLWNDSSVSDILWNGEYPNYQLIRYRTNKDGFINLIDTTDGTVNQEWDIDDPISTNDSLTQYLSKKSVNFRGGSSFGAPYFSFTGGVIFAVPEDLQTKRDVHYSDKLFVTTNSSELSSNKNYISDIYDFDSYYYPGAIVIYTETEGSVSDVRIEQNSHIVYNVADAVDSEGQITKVIRTFSRGKYYSYYVAYNKLSSLASEMPSVGDVIRFELDRNNCISGIKIDAKYNPTKKKTEVKYTTGGVTGYISYISGTVKAIGNGQLSLKVASDDFAPGTTINGFALVPLSNTRYTIFNTTTGEVRVGTINDVIPSNIVGIAEASRVVCRISYYAVTDMFIYVK